MLLFQQGGLENAMVNEMISKAKRKYVKTHHDLKISQMHTSDYKNGWWKTYVHDETKKSRRREVVRKTEEELYMTLYEHYKSKVDSPKTIEDVAEVLETRKIEQLSRSYNTIANDRRYLSYLSDDIKMKPFSKISEEDIRRWLVKEYLKTRPKESTLHKVLQYLNQLFRLGLSQKLCFVNGKSPAFLSLDKSGIL